MGEVKRWKSEGRRGEGRRVGGIVGVYKMVGGGGGEGWEGSEGS